MKKRSFLYDPQEYIGKLRKELIHKEFKPSVSVAVSTAVMLVLIFWFTASKFRILIWF